jgi:phosphoglycolate phosphatase-like HAD superfamily hydrolase
MKKVIFFDGDGTLWYPEDTKRTKVPHWVYLDESISNPIAEFVITPTTAETLQRLGEMGIKRVLLSTSPLPEEEAIMHRIRVAQHVDVHHLLDDILVAPDYPAGKGEQIRKWLEEHDMQADDALMVGDMYTWDLKSARDVGVDGLLVESDYQQEHIRELEANQVIDQVSGLLSRI